MLRVCIHTNCILEMHRLYNSHNLLKPLHSTGIFPSYSYPCIKRGAQPCSLCSELEPVDAFIVHLTAFYFVFLYCF